MQSLSVFSKTKSEIYDLKELSNHGYWHMGCDIWGGSNVCDMEINKRDTTKDQLSRIWIMF